MSNSCPVCQQESVKAKCERCGFEMPTFAFLSEDDANEWYRDTVPPYLINWLKNQNSELHSREITLQKQLKELKQVQGAPQPVRDPRKEILAIKRSIVFFVAGLVGLGLVGAITGAFAGLFRGWVFFFGVVSGILLGTFLEWFLGRIFDRFGVTDPSSTFYWHEFDSGDYSESFYHLGTIIGTLGAVLLGVLFVVFGDVLVGIFAFDVAGWFIFWAICGAIINIHLFIISFFIVILAKLPFFQ